jgi:hypothetical protein
MSRSQTTNRFESQRPVAKALQSGQYAVIPRTVKVPPLVRPTASTRPTTFFVFVLGCLVTFAACSSPTTRLTTAQTTALLTTAQPTTSTDGTSTVVPNTAVPLSSTTTAPLVTISPSVTGASQTDSDAKRDGVVPAVAAIALRDRVNPIIEHVTGEGVWVLSEVPDPQPGGGDACCIVGDRAGVNGRDWINTVEYREILLVDLQGTKILRAYPFPGLPPHEMIVAPNAIYCARQGDGGLPNSMLCRIDRTSLAIVVRVFPFGGGPDPINSTALIASWIIDQPVTDPVYSGLSFVGGTLTSDNGRATFDPQTLKRL